MTNTPHKCPACDGYGTRVDPDTTIFHGVMPPRVTCMSCKGSGIVWELRLEPLPPYQPYDYYQHHWTGCGCWFCRTKRPPLDTVFETTDTGTVAISGT